MMKKQYLEAGKIVSTHGVKGELRIIPWTDSQQTLASLKTLYSANGEEYKILNARIHKSFVLVMIDGINSVDEASKHRDEIVFLNRNDIELEKGSYFIQDIIGAAVYDADSSKKLGEITEVSQTGANDVWHINKDGVEYLVPSIPDVVISVDIDGKKAFIRPLKGIFD